MALRDTLSGSAKYVILRHGLDRAVADRVRAAIANKSVVGPVARARARAGLPAGRGGPASSLAAHLLGFVNREGGGQYGVEQAYQSTLAGQPRVLVAERDASGRRDPRRRDRPRAGHARRGPDA